MAFKDVTKDDKQENWFFRNSRIYSAKDRERPDDRHAIWKAWIIVDHENRKILIGDKLARSETIGLDEDGVPRVLNRGYQVELVPMSYGESTLRVETSYYTTPLKLIDKEKVESLEYDEIIMKFFYQLGICSHDIKEEFSKKFSDKLLDHWKASVDNKITLHQFLIDKVNEYEKAYESWLKEYFLGETKDA